MSVQYFFPKYRLAKALREPGGKAFDDAIRDANAQLETIRDDCLATIDAALTDIEWIWREMRPDPSAEELMVLYRAVNGMIGVAGVAGLIELDQAAYGLCEMIDRMVNARKFNREMISVHIRAFNLLRHPQVLGEVGKDAVLTGLTHVRDKVPADSAADADLRD